ncbi:hypothetical protein LINGRAHAP2_LOCUS31911 [Linum grandiflorum]
MKSRISLWPTPVRSFATVVLFYYFERRLISG